MKWFGGHYVFSSDLHVLVHIMYVGQSVLFDDPIEMDSVRANTWVDTYDCSTQDIGYHMNLPYSAACPSFGNIRYFISEQNMSCQFL